MSISAETPSSDQRFHAHDSPNCRFLDPEITCTTARSRDDYEQAFGCLYDNYLKAGLCHPNPARMRVMPFQLWRETQLFVCKRQGRVLGTISLVLDDRKDLPAESVFPDQIAYQRSGHRIAELCSLAIVRIPTAGLRQRVFAELTSIAVQFARRHSIDRLVAAVHPKHARVYERLMGFQQVAGQIPHEGVRGNPATLIMVPLLARDKVLNRWQHWYFDHQVADGRMSRSSIPSCDRAYFGQAVSPNAPTGGVSDLEGSAGWINRPYLANGSGPQLGHSSIGGLG